MVESYGFKIWQCWVGGVLLIPLGHMWRGLGRILGGLEDIF
jgi:hypothetical protein